MHKKVSKRSIPNRLRGKLIYALLAALPILPIDAQVVDPIPLGQVIDSIPVGQGGSDTYAAYLPASYSQDRLNPVLFIFDPVARGALGVKTFVPVADAHGLILICSNNSRNGPYDNNFEVANRLFTEVFNRFTIGQEAIYATGFSGGSRLAATLAVLSGQFRGVLGCGAGFEQSSNYMVRPGATFRYVGVVGNRDMNFLEMHHTRDLLNRFGITNKLIIFEGDHRWPPAESLLRAMDWLVLPAQPVDSEGRVRSLRAARAYEAEGKLMDAVREYQDLELAYGSNPVLDSIPGHIRELERSRAYRQEVLAFENVREREKELLDGLLQQLAQERLNSDTNLENWQKAWNAHQKQFNPPENPAEADMVARIDGSIRAVGIERADSFRRSGNFTGSQNLSRMLTVSFPQWPYAWIRLAQDQARLNEETAMFVSLQQAVALGYDNREFLEDMPAFQPFVKRDAWLSLFAGMK